MEPYDKRFGRDLDVVTPEQLMDQATALGVRRLRDVVLLGGSEYVTRALKVWPHATIPLVGPMGQQLAQAKRIREQYLNGGLL